jgi:hypothetical protein
MSFFTKTLFMVGVTRSKHTLQMTYAGQMHRYLTEISLNCIQIDAAMSAKPSTNNDFDFDF